MARLMAMGLDEEVLKRFKQLVIVKCGSEGPFGQGAYRGYAALDKYGRG